jgi:hypothetical protein
MEKFDTLERLEQGIGTPELRHYTMILGEPDIRVVDILPSAIYSNLMGFTF